MSVTVVQSSLSVEEWKLTTTVSSTDQNLGRPQNGRRGGGRGQWWEAHSSLSANFSCVHATQPSSFCVSYI